MTAVEEGTKRRRANADTLGYDSTGLLFATANYTPRTLSREFGSRLSGKDPAGKRRRGRGYEAGRPSEAPYEQSYRIAEASTTNSRKAMCISSKVWSPQSHGIGRVGIEGVVHRVVEAGNGIEHRARRQLRGSRKTYVVCQLKSYFGTLSRISVRPSGHVAFTSILFPRTCMCGWMESNRAGRPRVIEAFEK